MPDEPGRDDNPSPRAEVGTPDGLVDSDDTTQADAGMAGGTGTVEGQATTNPLGTEPFDDAADTGADET